MAKSKRHKKGTRNRAVFYEAVPLFMAPPATLPEVPELREGRAAIAKWIRQFAGQIIKTVRDRKIPSLNLSSPFHLTADRRTRIHALTLAASKTTLQSAKFISARFMATGLAATNWLIQAFHASRLTVSYAADVVSHYAPSITADIRQYGGKLLGHLFSRRSRALFLALMLTGILATITIGTSMAARTLNSYANDISSPAALLAKKKTGTTILDKNGEVLFSGYGAQSLATVKLSDLPKSLIDATLAAEDPEFYSHPGFSWRGTARAAWVDITRGGRIEGGSTLTQQLVKNALLSSDKKFQRKFQEVLLAMQLERKYSKDQILEMYLNEVYYGQGASGVEAASRTYFHKSARELTLAESAMIAGLPLGPSRFDPNVSVEDATGRRDFVLGRMLELGKISKTAAAAAKASPIQLANAGNPTPAEGITPMTVHARQLEIKAPHFVFYVLKQLRNQYGDDVVEHGGITVHTTLDLSKQQLAERVVANQISTLSSHHVTNGGLISIEPSSGHILAMVGSVNYNAPGFGNVNVTLSELQPGSSFKPIAYVTAFKKGYTGATQIDDTPLSVPNGDGTMYTPQNYDLEFHGRVSVRQALGNSLNIPAVKVLQYAGIDDTIQTAHDLGVTSLKDRNRFGLALVLGGGEVRPIDMATVYSTFANGGVKVLPKAITRVSDRNDNDITKPSGQTNTRVLDERLAYMITHILSDNNARVPEFPVNSPLKLSRPAAAKTGTTNDFRDNWTIGYTPQLVTAVWVGNNDHSAMEGVTGITGAAPIWHDYMEGALADQPIMEFTPPAGITLAKVCSDGGLLTNPWDIGVTEAFKSDAMPGPCRTFPKPPEAPKDDQKKDDKILPSPPDNPTPIDFLPADDPRRRLFFPVTPE